ncbi:CAAX geranylgeranyltransferase alpha subunit [Coemansia sp. RSA 2708]|nr:CAAX geranylgeranyltransferase alpha subunit [Coemansia sp. RSA 2708]
MRIDGCSDIEDPAPLAQQAAWQDVEPIAQDDGPSPICPIAYTDEYREMMGYLRAVMAAGEESARALALSGRVIQANPGHYTAWVYRKRLVEALASDIGAELDWVSALSAKHPKNYQLWHHREALVERLWPARAALALPEDQRLANPVLRRELQFVGSALDEDAKNFHAWSYRQWLVARYELWAQELAFVDTMISQDVRNNSAWNQRYFAVLRGRPATTQLDAALARAEVAYAVEHIQFAPNNDSPWAYVVGLLLRHAPAALHDELLPRIRALAADPGFAPAMSSTPFYWSALVDIHEQQARALPPAERAPLLDEARAICDRLATQVDITHNRYWRFRKTAVGAA